MTQEELARLVHLAADWDARAAQFEREHQVLVPRDVRAYVLRECAGQLRDVLAMVQLAP